MDIKKEEYYDVLLKQYAEDTAPDTMVDEAITTLEDYFDGMDKQEFLHHNRVLAISYLALKHIKFKDH